ncbi:MAG: sterol desaturase family protein [Myxococcota bacterium]
MSFALSLAAGALLWTLLEYVLHRWLGHRFRRNFFGAEHTRHHSQGDYFAPSWKKFVAALVAAALTFSIGVLVVQPTLAAAFTLGLVGCYLGYEMLHRWEHVHEGLSAYGRWARRHHFHHHFVNPSSNHGVTTPLWDWVFGTYERPKSIAVPERLAMRWLLDGEGDLRAGLDPCYSLRRRRPAMSASKRPERAPSRR